MNLSLLMLRVRVVVLEKSTESIVDGEKDKHIDHREHQTGVDTGVKGGKGCIKLLWTHGESRMDGRWRDARENGWSEKERKTTTKMAGHPQGVCEQSHHQQHEMPGIERDGEELPRLSPGVGCDSTAQGNKVMNIILWPVSRKKLAIGKLNTFSKLRIHC